jgi:hypothetical protein
VERRDESVRANPFPVVDPVVTSAPIGVLVRRTLAVLVASLSVLACDVTATSPLTADQRFELSRAERRWRAAGLQNYDFEHRMSCFCPPETATLTRIEVRNGVVSRVVPLTTFVTQEEADRYPYWPTIDSLLAMIRGAVDADWVADVHLRFDARYGYPIEATLISKPNIADAGLGLHVSGFVVR